jgi:hypothetical protein
LLSSERHARAGEDGDLAGPGAGKASQQAEPGKREADGDHVSRAEGATAARMLGNRDNDRGGANCDECGGAWH